MFQRSAIVAVLWSGSVLGIWENTWLLRCLDLKSQFWFQHEQCGPSIDLSSGPRFGYILDGWKLTFPNTLLLLVIPLYVSINWPVSKSEWGAAIQHSRMKSVRNKVKSQLAAPLTMQWLVIVDFHFVIRSKQASWAQSTLNIRSRLKGTLKYLALYRSLGVGGGISRHLAAN